VNNKHTLSALKKDCMFCDEELVIRKSTKDFRRFFPNLKNYQQVIFEGKEAVLIPDISPLTQGHLLLLSKKHYQSWAQASRRIAIESELILEKVRQYYAEIYPDKGFFIFEHGPGKINGQVYNCGSCKSISHAHMHILPIPRKAQFSMILLNDKIKTQTNLERISYTSTRPISSLKAITKEKPYLLIFDYLSYNGCIFLQEDCKSNIPSQLLRILFATTIFQIQFEDRTHWDWHDFPLLHTSNAETQ
jgi:diadenosine tetraphosphate (Ap4A) HIT family hydrolase